jgi:hypothetical protein
MLNPWILETLKKKGITVNANGKFTVEFTKGKVQVVEDLDAVIRQQNHIITQQRKEQEENEKFGVLMKEFHDIVCSLTKMTIEQLNKKKSVLGQLSAISSAADKLSTKREDLRKEGFNKIVKVLDMLNKGNIPAANLASQAALTRMRKRWIVNQQVIDKAIVRFEALKQLKKG